MCGPADCNKTELEDVASSVNATFTYLLAMIGMNPPTVKFNIVLLLNLGRNIFSK